MEKDDLSCLIRIVSMMRGCLSLKKAGDGVEWLGQHKLTF